MSIKIVLEHTIEEVEHLFKELESHAKAHNALMASVKQQAEAQLGTVSPAPAAEPTEPPPAS
jgi:hypothetical protein